MTAFYMFRLYYCIFWGKTNDNYAHHTPHESPVVMTLPLMILAAITIVAGWIMPFGHFVSSNGHAYDIHLDTTVATTSIIVAVVAILIATWMYAGKTQTVADMLQKKFSRLHYACIQTLLHGRALAVRDKEDYLPLYFYTSRMVRPSRHRPVYELHGMGY